MTPLYTPDNTSSAFELNWGLTLFWRDAPVREDLWLAELQAATEPDGVRVSSTNSRQAMPASSSSVQSPTYRRPN